MTRLEAADLRGLKKYVEIYELYRNDILKGVYKKGDKLPSKRVAADRHSVSTITIERAYELLDEEGYVRSEEKRGYFVAFDEPGRAVDRKEAKVTESTGTAAGTGGTDVWKDKKALSFDIYAKTVRRVLSVYGDEVLVKSPVYGCAALRTAISDYLGRCRNIYVEPGRIIIGSGAEYLYGLIVQTFGTEMIYGLESPSYNKIETVYSAFGAKCDMLTLASDGIESEKLQKTKAGLLHITPYRSYPSGVSATAAKKREYVKWAAKRNGILVEDDFESEFSPSRKNEETLMAIDGGERVIYVNTFSMTISPSVRVAYMVVPERLLGRFSENTGFYSCTVPTLDQYVIAELIGNGDFERHINRVRRLERQEKRSNAQKGGNS